jgi:hypothetical protein
MIAWTLAQLAEPPAAPPYLLSYPADGTDFKIEEKVAAFPRDTLRCDTPLERSG